MLDRDAHTSFPVTQGDAHATIPCGDCHDGFDSFTQFSCVSCHRHSAGNMDPSHTTVTGYRYDSVACATCHPDGLANITPAGHRWFPIVAGTPHVGIDCYSCHVSGQPRSAFDCLQCHQPKANYDLSHTAVLGYAYESPACYICHPAGTVAGTFSRTQHAPFPIGTGSQHVTVACTGCHIDNADLDLIDCAGCHHSRTAGLDTAHGVMSDYLGREWDSPLCMRCHYEGDVPITASQHNAAGVDVSGPHTRCLGCHDSVQSAWLYFAAADYIAYSCYGSCHEHTQTKMAEAHQGQLGYSYSFPVCLTCHPNAKKQ